MLEKQKEDSTEDETIYAAYIIEGAPLVYYGELYFAENDPEQKTVILHRPLMKVFNSKENKQAFLRVPAAGKDSRVYINKSAVHGILVVDIDPEEVNEYQEAYVRAHSKLHLAPG